MKTGRLIKSPDTDVQAELALVNQYTRRELSPEEVYLFSVVLCDNDVDRDGERFTVESLFALEKLFVGKTGIVDHDPKAANMKARIISCRTEAVDGKKTALGDDYFRLTARAYILKSADNAPLIDAIDAGIVKEVSVGCAVERTVCSICGQDMRTPACSHRSGHEYGGRLCVGELTHPTDAYEFSFVAVPSQKEAGVIKAYQRKDRNMNDIIKSLYESDELTLNKSELRALCDHLDALGEKAQDGEAYRKELEREVLIAATKAAPISSQSAGGMLKKLSTAELREIKTALARAHETSAPQLAPHKDAGSGVQNHQFTI